MTNYLKLAFALVLVNISSCKQEKGASDINVYERGNTAGEASDHLWCEHQYWKVKITKTLTNKATGVSREEISYEEREGFCLYSVKRKKFGGYDTELLTPFGHPRTAIGAHISMYHSRNKQEIFKVLERCKKPLSSRLSYSGWRNLVKPVIDLGAEEFSANSYQHGDEEKKPHKRSACRALPKVEEYR